MATLSFNLLSDAELVAPKTFNLLSDAVLVPPNSFDLLSDALVLPASAFAMTSDAMICLTSICEGGPVVPIAPPSTPPSPSEFGQIVQGGKFGCKDRLICP